MHRWILWIGLLMAGVSANADEHPAASVRSDDPRLPKLKKFFEHYGSPGIHLVDHFLLAADRYGLDWRLLPTISIVETGGGKTARNNNLLGWNSARKKFASAQESLYFVASRLANSKTYRGKKLDALLASYNKRPEWVRLVKAVMRRVDPGEPLRARRENDSVSPLKGSLQSTNRPVSLPSR